MDWLKEPEVWTLISTDLAQRLRVLPLGRDGECVRFLAGDNLSEEQKTKIKETLSFRLGAPVVLESLENHPELELGGFNELLDKYYYVRFPTMLSRPVASDLMTILLIEDNPSRRKRAVADYERHGHRVVSAASPDDALAILQFKSCNPKRIVVTHEMLAKYKNELDALAESLDAQITFEKSEQVEMISI